MPRFVLIPTRARQGVIGAGLVLLCLACAEEPAGPSAATVSAGPRSADPSAADPSAIAPAPVEAVGSLLETRSSSPGVVFGTFNMRNTELDNVHTGWMNGGPLEPSNILSWLSGARAKKARVVIKLCKGHDKYVKNSDGTFSLTKWKALVSSYRNVNLGPYIADGTILGHYLIDEPHREGRWGGRPISQATLEEMAKFSKSIWPDMTTFVRAVPSWLAQASLTYRYLDAGWAQFAAGKGNPATYASSEAAAAKRKGLGLVVGLNVINGGDGSSKIRGLGGDWSMSATEIRKYGDALLGESHACGFFNWNWDDDYYRRSDIRSAMADVSAQARAHTKTSCRL